ncbi:hypothetical protein C8046_17335 [Serinibacter arcticus]|uniref:3-hydroxyacyl-CoA dehydrogenase n=1 Tax=Serinibacter arcticus TaxID=1655435 RepID=A0A2U1ZYV0_9MICO|nr:Rv3235 family protein [Serinibacter arcticus]PWD52144.1 hypothetical protein C8046_17335 [Serinibacter arcticus]
MSALPVDPDLAGTLLPAPEPLPLRPPTARERLSLAPTRPGAPGERGDDPSTRPSAPVDGDRWFGALALAVVEVLSGARPAQQLLRWLTPEIYGALARRAGLHVRVHGRPTRPVHGRVLSTRAEVTDSGHVEVCAVIHDGSRVRAVAGRLEVFRDRWRVVEMQIG